jgi:hypothetical protein
MSQRIIFTEEQVNSIIIDYVENKLSCVKIGKKIGVSKFPVQALLKKMDVLRKGYSNGIKLNLSKELKDSIKKLYVTELKTPIYISEALNLNRHFLEKYIYNSEFGRNRGESITLRQTGKKRSEHVKLILKNAQQEFAKSGKRKQTGGVCKRYIISGLICNGTYEKFYIEKLIKEKKKLPQNSESINTPFGVYYPDFLNGKSLVEIKSDYTYDVLIGKKKSRWTKKYDTTQLEKIKWVNENVKPVDILVVDKRNNKIIKK